MEYHKYHYEHYDLYELPGKVAHRLPIIENTRLLWCCAEGWPRNPHYMNGQNPKRL